MGHSHQTLQFKNWDQIENIYTKNTANVKGRNYSDAPIQSALFLSWYHHEGLLVLIYIDFWFLLYSYFIS